MAVMRKTFWCLAGFLVAGQAFAAPEQYRSLEHASNKAEAISRQENIDLNSLSVVVYDQYSGETLLAKNPNLQTPIASITKLMTAVVTLDTRPNLDERITINAQDVDRLKGTGSRLALGAVHTREQLLNLALIASENRAAHALGRTYPGGIEAFVSAMNRKARQLGMRKTLFVDPTGLSSFNQSTAEDLVKLVDYAYANYPEIRQISATGEYSLGKQRVVVRTKKSKRRQASKRVYYRNVGFVNTNRLTRQEDWQIGLSKTGYINEAGHCLVMQAEISRRPVIIVLLDAQGKYGRLGDANRIKHWLEENSGQFNPPTSRGT